uniref:Retrotransposon Copia-like N-terminal domain-containing protein n=2 Tax=Nicotiana TaxID=4085 RepID=A0A1S3Y4E6_TOBAC|nr:PREDICTED: uncharacterized protein LOC107772065 [Nicotiana tabacum]
MDQYSPFFGTDFAIRVLLTRPDTSEIVVRETSSFPDTLSLLLLVANNSFHFVFSRESIENSLSALQDRASVSATSVGFGLMDSAHPYYLHPSDYPGMNLISSSFDGRGYGGWRRVVVIALYAKNKLGFIDGTLVMPDVESGLQRAWSRCNDLVLSWLLNSFPKKMQKVSYSESAKDMWNDLEDRFGLASGANFSNYKKN